jgi:hypothetical protein
VRILLGIARILPGISPDVLGIILGMYWNSTRGVLLVTTVDRFLPTFSDFLGRYSYYSCIHMTHCFFFRDRPPEELDNKRSSARRGEFDSSTPEAIGV